ncbi:GDSL lipase/esterase [Flammula alnicola]|nr:GDSL lipase/esterase [Flammula alnicola]
MIALRSLRSFFLASLAISSCAAKLSWADTKFLITLGDSYTTDGFNISAGVDSPVPGFTSSNGPNWVQQLGSTYNVGNTKVFNLASGGATIDAKLVTPFEPTVLSIVDQVAQFKTFLAPKPSGAQWSSNNTLFAIWIGINDVGNSFGWTNITQSQFNTVLMNRLESQLEILYENGARSFLFLTVPPTNRAPLLIEQGSAAVAKITSDLANYNSQLRTTALSFQAKHRDIETVTVFDTQPVFNTLLDNAKTFGFVNTTGFCEAYENGTPSMTTQIAPCAPVNNYFWLNTLHPLFTVHKFVFQHSPV